MNQYEMRDPRKQYPLPDFPGQLQSAPGLAREMDSQPDHCESSYKGFGRKAVVTGADSGIGRAVAIAFAREGADLALNDLPNEAPDADEMINLVRGAGAKAVT
jgi:hypothetical protein